MIITKRKKRDGYEDVVSAIQCDKCGEIYPEDNIIEMQEFHHIRFRGGYGSVFGDDIDFECNICQHCLKELVGDIIRVVE